MFARAGGSRPAAKLSRSRRTRRGGQLPQWERVYQHKVTKRRSWATQLIDSIGCLLARSGSISTGIRDFAPASAPRPLETTSRTGALLRPGVVADFSAPVDDITVSVAD